MVKNLPATAGDMDLITGSRRSPGEENDNPLQYSCLGNGPRSLVGYSPRDHKELDMTERLTLLLWSSLEQRRSVIGFMIPINP